MRVAGRLQTQCCLMGVLAGCAMAQTPLALPPSAEEFQSAFQRSDWPRAIESAKSLLANGRSDDPSAAYYLACAFARAGQKDDALPAVTTCVDRGWFQTALLERDSDLDSVRSAPEFADAVEKSRQTAGVRLDRHKSIVEHLRLEKAYPRDYSGTKPIPMILALHGFGSSGAEIVEAWRKAADDVGAVLVAPTAPHLTALDGYGWGSTEEGEAIVLGAIDLMTKAHAADPSKIVLTGFSQGGTLAAGVALRHPDLFAGVIPICSVFDPATAAVPLKAMPFFPRFAILNGADDAEAENNRTATRLFNRVGVPVRFRLYPGVGHAFPRDRDLELRSAGRFVLNIPDQGK